MIVLKNFSITYSNSILSIYDLKIRHFEKCHFSHNMGDQHSKKKIVNLFKIPEIQEKSGAHMIIIIIINIGSTIYKYFFGIIENFHFPKKCFGDHQMNFFLTNEVGNY